MEKIEKLYGERFNLQEIRAKNEVWRILCQNFFQKYIDVKNAALDLGGLLRVY